jgi:hypothetical protein
MNARLAQRSRKTLAERRLAAAERQRRRRLRLKLIAAGFEHVELWLSPAVRAGWVARERIDDRHSPLPSQSYCNDLVVILTEWAARWLRACQKVTSVTPDRR